MTTTHARTRARLVRELRASASRFDAAATARKQLALQQLRKLPLAEDQALLDYHDALLFLAAHPSDAAMQRSIESEFARLAAFLKPRRGRHKPLLANHGLPWVDTTTRFSHDCLRWLLAHPQCRVAIDQAGEPLLDLNAVLKLTLPALERGETSAGLDNDTLLDALKVRPAQRLAFLVNELGRLDALPHVKDQLFDALDLFVRVAPTSAALSKAGNRLDMGGKVFFQAELLRHFDPLQVMNQPLGKPRRLSDDARQDVIRVLKNTMLLTSRETDPATYLDPAALRVHDLERGLSVAMFGMAPARQLPLESYVGFTLFKNGFPVAYGGAWLLGERAAFGMNIFEPFRGGESGFMMCQVLRAYRQTFGVRYFEVDAHQFGLDNPDGIASGAYWFYWRHGFRSLTPALRTLAERERKRITATPGYRSPENTLLRFTESSVALNFGGPVPPQLAHVTARVTRMIARVYRGDRVKAEADCATRFAQAAALTSRPTTDERRVLAEVGLIWRALNVQDAESIALLARMVRAKPKDLFAYQQLLLQFFARTRQRRTT